MTTGKQASDFHTRQLTSAPVYCSLDLKVAKMIARCMASVEHPHVVTIGRNGKHQNLSSADGWLGHGSSSTNLRFIPRQAIKPGACVKFAVTDPDGNGPCFSTR